MKKGFMVFSSRILMLTMLSMSLWTPSAQAGMIGTEQVLNTQSSAQRDHIKALFNRQEVRDQLQAKGVDLAMASARVDAMTDDEVAMVSEKIDNLPAGGDLIGTLVFVFLVLLVTDILGLTHFFPFVKHRR